MCHSAGSIAYAAYCTYVVLDLRPRTMTTASTSASKARAAATITMGSSILLQIKGPRATGAATAQHT
jgi:hypothetical protein